MLCINFRMPDIPFRMATEHKRTAIINNKIQQKHQRHSDWDKMKKKWNPRKIWFGTVLSKAYLFFFGIFLGPVPKTARRKMPFGVCIGVRKCFGLRMSACIVGLSNEKKKIIYLNRYVFRPVWPDFWDEYYIILSKTVFLSLSLYVPFVLLKFPRPHGYEFVFTFFITHCCYCIYFFFHFIRFDVSFRYSTISSFTWRDYACMCVVNCIGCSE